MKTSSKTIQNLYMVTSNHE